MRRLRRRPLGAIVPVLGTCAIVPVGLLMLIGDRHVMPPMWVHFYGVGVSALVATAAAVLLTTVGAHERDSRTVIVGGGFSLMAALLAVHGLMTPGVLVGMNGLIKVTGAATLPVGAAVMMLAALPPFTGPRAIRRVLAVEAALGSLIVALSLLGALVPSSVPGVPDPKTAPAIALFAAGLALYGALAVRAVNTFLLTRRIADFAVVLGIVLLACALYGALILNFMQLGWWLGHIFELAGIVVVGASLVYDLRRGRRSRPLIGDLRAAELVAAEEAYLGARVRALMERPADKDTSTERHTGTLGDDEYAIVKLHPERGYELLSELGGFDESVSRLVLDHHERLDGSGYPRGVHADDLDLATRILAVCDVYDALVSKRVYRPAWAQDDALALLREESETAFDARCVEALERVVAPERVLV
jgi:hypothetical protein